MGFRFRKSVKLGKGVRLNIGKKGVGLSVGTKGARFSFNSSGRKSATFGIPGTGISYTANLSKKKKRSQASHKSTSAKSLARNHASAVASDPKQHEPETFLSSAEYLASSKSNFICGIVAVAIGIFVSFLASSIGWLLVVLGAYWLLQSLSYRLNAEGADERNARLLEWQNVVLEAQSDDLFMGDEWLTEESTRQIQEDMRIIKDSNDIVEKTTNAETFFSRINLIAERAKHIDTLRCYISPDYHPEADSITGAQMDDEITRFIRRYCDAVIDGAASLKTEKGKQNRYKKAVDELTPYLSMMSTENKDYVMEKFGIVFSSEDITSI